MKTFIGPRLRRLRLETGQTQAQMARALGISTSYVNLLEKNERSVSVAVLLKLLHSYDVDWRDIADDDDTASLAALRAALQGPLFEGDRPPDLTELRAALSHSPGLVASFLRLHRAFLAASDQLMSAAGDGDAAPLAATPESAVHDLFRRHRNHFAELEQAAERFWDGARVAPDDVYAALKARLRERPGLQARILPASQMPQTLREYDEAAREVRLSEALDHPNRVFQLVHVAGLVEHRALLERLLANGPAAPAARTRALVELANYFAAAVLMPYQPFLDEAAASQYDFDHLATRFGVSFEQACQRATTLQRAGAAGVPFFFLRLDCAGNVTKRFNATDFHLAEHGGACPRLEVHSAFRIPGRILPQFVEMPDASRFFVFARTVDRPSFSRGAQGVRLAIAMGCAVAHAGEVGYAAGLALSDATLTRIGINCRICPRKACDQRAHPAVVLPDAPDERRRGTTRYAT